MKEAIYYNSNFNVINLIYFDKNGIVRVLSSGILLKGMHNTPDFLLKVLVEDGYELIGYV